MKKEILIIALVLGLSFKSYAGTGNAYDGPIFFLVIIGFFLILLGLLSSVDFFQKNGKTIFLVIL